MDLCLCIKCKVLHEITNDQLQSIDKVITNFIWKGKRPKISLKILRCDKSQGGLGLVDLVAKHQALQFNWIKRINENPEIRALANYFLGEHVVNENLIWKANISQADAKAMGKQGFWRNLLTIWSKFHYFDPQNGESVKKQFLWLNSHIKHSMGPKRSAQLNRCGLSQIEDIIKNGNAWKTAEEIRCEFNCDINQLEYNSIITSIPHHWKFFLRTPNLIDEQVDKWSLIESNKKISKVMYYKIINNDKAWQHSVRMWNEKLQEEFNLSIHQQAFRNLYKVTNITKYRDFQFRLLHNKIFCNDILFYWKIKSSQICDYCDTKQSIIHLMWSCSEVHKFWDLLKAYLCDRNSEAASCVFNCANIIYNLVHPKPSHVNNFVILTAKFFLYRCKIKEKKPNA